MLLFKIFFFNNCCVKSEETPKKPGTQAPLLFYFLVAPICTELQKNIYRDVLCDTPECSKYNPTARGSVLFRCGSKSGIKDLTVDVPITKPEERIELRVRNTSINITQHGN